MKEASEIGTASLQGTKAISPRWSLLCYNFRAFNAILKFTDNGPIMLRNAPIMLKVAPIMLKVLFLSNLCTLIQKKRNTTPGPVAILGTCCSVALYLESSPRAYVRNLYTSDMQDMMWGEPDLAA